MQSISILMFLITDMAQQLLGVEVNVLNSYLIGLNVIFCHYKHSTKILEVFEM